MADAPTKDRVTTRVTPSGWLEVQFVGPEPDPRPKSIASMRLRPELDQRGPAAERREERV